MEAGDETWFDDEPERSHCDDPSSLVKRASFVVPIGLRTSDGGVGSCVSSAAGSSIDGNSMSLLRAASIFE